MKTLNDRQLGALIINTYIREKHYHEQLLSVYLSGCARSHPQEQHASPALQAVFHAPNTRSQTCMIQHQNTTVPTRNQKHDFIVMNADTNSFRQYVKEPSTAAKSPTHGKGIQFSQQS